MEHMFSSSVVYALATEVKRDHTEIPLLVLYFEDVFIECFTCFHYVISSTNFELEATKRN
jgi:hypothetical protein